MRAIQVGVDVFASIWAVREAGEDTEDAILRRLLVCPPTGRIKARRFQVERASPDSASARLPKSKKWTELLVWTLQELGGQASLQSIYRKSEEGRRALGFNITQEHDASARECLESHCKDSSKYRGKADLFWMPEGKGAGIWALR